MTTVLSVAEAQKSFGETTALDGAELELHQGEWPALLGPRGAGMTTLVRALARRVQLVAVLGGRTAVFLVIAKILARRWKTV